MNQRPRLPIWTRHSFQDLRRNGTTFAGAGLVRRASSDTLREGTFPLSGIGSAGDRVGYHLSAHLAMHRLLRRRDRPAPAFLLLDHPTGPFYPEDIPEGTEPELRSENDREVVATIFQVLREVANDLGDDLQILVCDHYASFGEPWFEDALVDNWRGGRG